ncbi:MAG: isoprenoid biosynthesis glyoxalase ElbB [Deltaproteobacteria bacterium]|nr:isoprenoid biosynthesis glyoxalase ElbB [Deltaproteobacteria bacterium]
MTTVGILLAGCGVNDGTEIHEAVLTMLALDRLGARRLCLGPDMEQYDVVNHLSGAAMPEKRNALVEAARIARGEIRPLAEVDPAELDALILPGGFGAAKNLSDFAVAGALTRVRPEVLELIKSLHRAKKPIGAICIAPAVVARALGEFKPRLTIGNDPGTAALLAGFGACHVDCPVADIVVDEEQRLVSTPAYMLGPGLKEIVQGIDKLVARVVALAG